MPVIGFDDEQVRDAWVEEEVRRAAWLALEAGPMEGTVEAELTAGREAIRAFVDAVVEAFRPLMEVCQAIGEAVLREIERVWELIEGVGEEPAGRYQGPKHYNCRCLPVERVDPVRAGRTRWWTRK